MIEVAFTNGDTVTIRAGKSAKYDKEANMFLVNTGNKNVLIPATHVLYIGTVKEDEHGNTVFL